jgi:hypothetical protein
MSGVDISGGFWTANSYPLSQDCAQLVNYTGIATYRERAPGR